MIMSREGEMDLSFLLPQLIPDGLLFYLQVHGDRNSMMQNITYNPADQDLFVPFSFCSTATNFTNTGAHWFSWKTHISSLEDNQPV